MGAVGVDARPSCVLTKRGRLGRGVLGRKWGRSAGRGAASACSGRGRARYGAAGACPVTRATGWGSRGRPRLSDDGARRGMWCHGGVSKGALASGPCNASGSRDERAACLARVMFTGTTTGRGGFQAKSSRRMGHGRLADHPSMLEGKRRQGGLSAVGPMALSVGMRGGGRGSGRQRAGRPVSRLPHPARLSSLGMKVPA